MIKTKCAYASCVLDRLLDWNGTVVFQCMALCTGLVCLSIALAQTSSAENANVELKAPLKVMSFNIRYGTAKDGDNNWDLRKEFLVETIKKTFPDLLGTQESLGFQRDYLQSQMENYGVLGVGREDGGDTGEMMAMYYRLDRFEKVEAGHFWLSETPEVIGSKSWDSSLPRMCTWVKLRDRLDPQSLPILFMNTHFDHIGKVARLESAKLIEQMASNLGKGCDIVVTGDFNAGEGSDPYKALFSKNASEPKKLDSIKLIDSYRAVNTERMPNEGTYTGFKAENNRGDRIDWIAVNERWEVREAWIDRTQKDGHTPSDHFPVHALLQR